MKRILFLVPVFFLVVGATLLNAIEARTQDAETVTLWIWDDAAARLLPHEYPVEGGAWTYRTTNRGYQLIDRKENGEEVSGWTFFLPKELAGGVAEEIPDTGTPDWVIPLDQLSVIPFPTNPTNIMSLQNNQLSFTQTLSGFFEWGGKLYFIFDEAYGGWGVTDGLGNWWTVPQDSVQSTRTSNLQWVASATITFSSDWLTNWEQGSELSQ
jgi:hypothetical protein